jgi:hypothetical protein
MPLPKLTLPVTLRFMQDFSIFYSWQSDAPLECNKLLIRDALVAAIDSRDLLVPAPRFESGMDGTAGSPEVATVMFEKIRACSVFVADVTLVGSIAKDVGREGKSKKTPNPNVSLEMGFAAAAIGWDRIICVMNEANCFGTRNEQPFDVRNRRFPIDYKLEPEDAKDPVKRAKALISLTKWMKKGMEAVEKNELRKVEDARRRLDIKCLDLISVMGPRFSSFPEPTGATIAECAELGLLPHDRFNAAVVRLLELDILYVNFDATRRNYAYHWTYLGEKLLTDLKVRELPNRGAAAT